jgi:hypothetical protein
LPVGARRLYGAWSGDLANKNSTHRGWSGDLENKQSTHTGWQQVQEEEEEKAVNEVDAERDSATPA